MTTHKRQDAKKAGLYSINFDLKFIVAPQDNKINL